jgi:hypothetical protein
MFAGMSLALLLIVLLGFARTFFLRAFFDGPPIPIHVYIHGVVLTAWFVWFYVQALLARAGRVDLHRRLGVAGAVLGVAVIVANVTVVAWIGPRLRFLLYGAKLDPAFLVHVVWGNIGSIISFAVLLAFALGLRRRPQIHKRLMFFASISIVGQAVARIAHWPLAVSPGLLVDSVFLLLLGSIVTYDLVTTRRVHPATLAGGGFRILIWAGSMWLAGTQWGQAVVYGLAE